MTDKNTDFIDIEIVDLTDALLKNPQAGIPQFEDVIDFYQKTKRQIYLQDILDTTGMEIDGMIRFWNDLDFKNNVPINERTPIQLFIDSPGGSLVDTLTMCDSIVHSTTPVHTIAIGSAYSGGFFTFICGHRRFAYPHASFLFHEGATSSGGTSSQFENYTDFYKKQLLQLKEITLAHTNFTEEEYEKMRRDDVWMDVPEAVKHGFVDIVIQ